MIERITDMRLDEIVGDAVMSEQNILRYELLDALIAERAEVERLTAEVERQGRLACRWQEEMQKEKSKNFMLLWEKIERESANNESEEHDE
jgi:hypothetical protein